MEYQRSKTTSHDGIRIQWSDRVSRLVNEFALWIFINFNDTLKTGEALFYFFFFKLIFSYEWNNCKENHVSLKMVFGYNAIRRTTYQSWSRFFTPTSSSSSSSGSTPPTSSPQESKGSTPIPASVECESAEEQARGHPSFNPSENSKQNKDGDHVQVRGHPSFSELSEWLQVFMENLVNQRVPEPHDSHTSSLH